MFVRCCSKVRDRNRDSFIAEPFRALMQGMNDTDWLGIEASSLTLKKT